MKKLLLNTLRFLIFLSIGVAILWWIMKDYSIGDLWSKIKSANYWWVGFSLIFAILSHLSRAIRWKILLESIGYKVRTPIAFFSVMIGYVSNLAFPRMGEVVRGGFLGKYDGIPLDKVFGTVVIERIVDLLLLLLLFVVAFFIQSDLIFEYIKPKLNNLLQQDMTILLIILALLVLGVFVFIKVRYKLKQTIIYNKLVKWLSGFSEGVKSIFNLKQKGLFVFHSIFIWIMYFLMTYLCFWSLPATEHLQVKAGVTTLALGSVGMAAPVQGGIGTYHIFVQKALLAYDVSGEDALVFAWLIYISQTILVICLGLLSFITISFFKRIKPNGNAPAKAV